MPKLLERLTVALERFAAPPLEEPKVKGPQVGECLIIGWIDGGRTLQEIGRCLELAEVPETHREGRGEALGRGPTLDRGAR